MITVVIALKALSDAKSRLAPRVPAAERADLTLAMAADTVSAAAGAADEVVVVAGEASELGLLKELGAQVVDDGDAADLNTAFEHGASLARQSDPGGIVAALQADLPALTTDAVSAALTAAAGRRAFCPDRHGTGTTMLISAPGGVLRPMFGADSAGAHRGSGAARLSAPAVLRTDVDTPDDLAHASRLGLGAHTSALIDRMRARGHDLTYR